MSGAYPAPVGDVVSVLVTQNPGVPLVIAVQDIDGQIISSTAPKTAFLFSTHGGAAGVAGADGEDATVHARRYEESGNYIYAGTAPAGSAEGSAVWRITRITYSSGTQTATGVATNVTWTGRAGHTYI